MSNGIRTTNLERQFAIDELIGNVTADGVEKTARIPVEALLNQLAGSGPFVFGNTVYLLTKAELDAYSPPNESMGGVVLNDPNAANNGYYARSSGAWVKGRGFPDTFARIDLSGSGTAQTGLVETGVNPADIEVFFAAVGTNNTGPLTLSIAGEAPRPVVNLAGNPLAPGEWTGVVLFYLNEDGHYQLLIDAGAAAAAAQSASEAAATLLDLRQHYAGAFASDSEATDAVGGTPEEGALYFNTGLLKLKTFVNGEWTVAIGDKGDPGDPGDQGPPGERDTRNFCWAGSFNDWQRGTTFTGTAARIGTADGWTVGRSSSATGHRVSQQQGSRGNNLCARVQRIAAETGVEPIAFVFNLGIADARPLAGKAQTVSFRARAGTDFSAASSSLVLQVKTSTSLTEQAIVSAAGSYTTGDTNAGGATFTLTTSWLNFSVTLTPGDDIAQEALRFIYTPVGTAGAADYFEIEEVQIQLGSTATDFVPLDPSYSKMKAQDQYRKSYGPAIAPGAVSYNGALRTTAVGTVAGEAVQIGVSLQPPMRTAPTVTLYSPQTGAAGKLAQAATADIDGTVVHIGPSGFGIQNVSVTTASKPYYVHYVAEAKL